jgi:hypothetical protein
MSFQELKDLIIQIVRSWEVIAVTIAVVLYVLLVSYVGRLYHRTRPSLGGRPKKAKAKAAKASKAAPETAPAESKPAIDELGIEEE